MIDKETNSPNVLLTRFALPFFTINGKTIVTAKAGCKCSDSEFVPPIVSNYKSSDSKLRGRNDIDITKKSKRKGHVMD